MVMSAPLTGSFAATGVSAAVTPQGDFNVTLTGFGTATVQIQRRFPGETNFHVVAELTGADAVGGAVARIVNEPEGAAEWRLACTAHTNNIAYRVSQ